MSTATPTKVPATVTFAEALKDLQVSRKTLHRMIESGRAPKPDLPIGSHHRWRRTTWDRYIRGDQAEAEAS